MEVRLPSVKSNTKYKCQNCGAIEDLSSQGNLLGNLHPCKACGSAEHWRQILVVLVCDFCATTQNVSWSFPCAPFTVVFLPGGEQRYDDDWAACDRCKQFILEDNREALVARALLMDRDKRNPLATALIRMVHNGFLNHRTGPPVPYEEDEHAGD